MTSSCYLIYIEQFSEMGTAFFLKKIEENIWIIRKKGLTLHRSFSKYILKVRLIFTLHIMAVLCSVKITGDYALVQAEKRERKLRFDLSKDYSRCYENTKEQAKAYLEEIIQWCGERPQNVDHVLKSLMMYLFVRRQEMGLVA